jgi:Ca2+-transporting ATPase
VTGRELDEMDEFQRIEAVRQAHVFARIAPQQKLAIVEAARQAREFVVVTGDGANDAPALRAANIGVAMGRSGTDVARDAASLVLADDNFKTIVAGIEEGRIAYDNIRKVVFLLISTGAAELLMVLLAILGAHPLPLLPVQLLWLNLVTNGIQGVALAFEPGEGDVLRRRPRPPGEAIFNQLMLERTAIAVFVMGGLAFAAFAWMVPENPTSHDVRAAQNTLLLLMVLFENFHIGNCRSETKSAFRLSPLRSPFLLLGAIGAFLVHFAAMHLPFMQLVLGLAPVSWETWITLTALALTIVPVMELHKWTWHLRYGRGFDSAARSHG